MWHVITSRQLRVSQWGHVCAFINMLAVNVRLGTVAKTKPIPASLDPTDADVLSKSCGVWKSQ